MWKSAANIALPYPFQKILGSQPPISGLRVSDSQDRNILGYLGLRDIAWTQFAQGAAENIHTSNDPSGPASSSQKPTKAYKGRKKGAVNRTKAHSIAFDGLDQEGQERLESYYQGFKNTRYGSNRSKGSIQDLLELLSYSIDKGGISVKELKANSLLMARLGLDVDEIRKEIVQEMQLELEKLRTESLLFDQYTPDAFDKVEGLTRDSFTESYDSVISSVRGLRDKAEKHIRKRYQNDICGVAYDNCDIKVGVHEQANDKKGELYSITIGIMYPYTGIPSENGEKNRPLLQTDFVDTHKLTLPQIIRTPEYTKILEEVKQAQIILSLEEAYPQVVANWKSKSPQLVKLSKMPAIDLLDTLPSNRRGLTPVYPIPLDESTTANNREILRNLTQQFGLDDEFFENNREFTILVGGDNKTLERIWSCKTIGKYAQKIYDQLHHIVVIPGLFHGQMHVGKGKRKRNEEDDREEMDDKDAEEGPLVDKINHSTLRYAAGKTQRKKISPTNQIYAHGRTFLNDCYQGRLLAEWNEHFLAYAIPNMKNGSNLKGDYNENDFLQAMRVLPAGQALALIKKVAQTIERSEICVDDNERAINLSFIYDQTTFLALSHGIKYGDIGLIAASLPDLIDLFARAKKQNYCKEFLYLLRLINSNHVPDPRARRALASVLLVNPSGRKDGWYPIDLANEFVNRDIKDQWSFRRYSTQAVTDIALYCTLNAVFFGPLRKVFYQLFGRTIHPRHNHRNRGIIIRTLGKSLSHSMRHNSDRENLQVPGIDLHKNDPVNRFIERQIELINHRFVSSISDDEFGVFGDEDDGEDIGLYDIEEGIVAEEGNEEHSTEIEADLAQIRMEILETIGNGND
ncbi:hypothetical protein EAF04_009509 [Stromatinia cepivora]|nr:hypothetical protein EAF04_009509 [Stromatinia cepivora]